MFHRAAKKFFDLRGITFRKISVACLLILSSFLVFEYYKFISEYSDNESAELDLCPIQPPNLVGPFTPDISKKGLESVEARFAKDLKLGGYYKPKECIARDRVAVLVTCRDREEQIPVFLRNIHQFMMRQQLEYQVFIIIQTHGFWFNKGALYNAGFKEAMKRKRWDCVIFHDIDMVPMDDRNMYDCPRVNPRHMAIDQDKFHFKLYNETYFGGVFAFTSDLYERLNGHSNLFWAWGGEDNDMYNRFLNAGYYLERYPHQVTTYKSLYHNQTYRNPEWKKNVAEGVENFSNGLSTLAYHIKEIEEKITFTKILVHFIPEELGSNPKEVNESNIPKNFKY